MSDSPPSDERAEIREQKAEELKAKLTSPDEPVHVSGQDELEEKVQSKPVVLVDFYADWCGPCKQLAPVIERLAASTDATVLKVDIDESMDAARAYGVSSVPTLFLFVDGEPVERLTGFRDEETLRQFVEQHT
ncbi:MAG: thioredoxin [Halovenus sp.]